jgi:hypothetical protein
LGPFITMNLAKVPKTAKVPEGSAPKKTSQSRPPALGSPPLSLEPQGPRHIHSAVAPPPKTLDLERFLDRHAHPDGRSVLGSSELLARYNRSLQQRGLPEISQRRLGDAMRALGHHNKPRLADGRIHYQGLAWKEAETEAEPGAAYRLSQRRRGPQAQLAQAVALSHRKNGIDGKHGGTPAARMLSWSGKKQSDDVVFMTHMISSKTECSGWVA